MSLITRCARRLVRHAALQGLEILHEFRLVFAGDSFRVVFRFVDALDDLVFMS